MFKIIILHEILNIVINLFYFTFAVYVGKGFIYMFVATLLGYGI